ncbi:dihydrofolate reductase [Stackebrandtia endophytica]|uniref:Dihydrofolate reductase n=1 Tax=Stackebrandtia endophytica TaxID=1496996 RepID=A0A543AWZ9_9ACTN|nr:dihydrofolate reductase family protein [Stackebrandtia endophytica]TQL77105.1 dihydrofolate reductase [Stackebrandtia endophytica]
MGKLLYSMATSLDGYVVDADGRYDWSEPDEETHAFFNEYTSRFGTYLYGRRMYREMVYWETVDQETGHPEVVYDFGRRWRAADKVVYSTTLEDVSSAKTTLERSFDPDAVRRLKDTTDLDMTIEGPTLAVHALRAGLVDEIHQFLSPVIVGGGISFFPDDLRIDLDLIDERRFPTGMVMLQYRVRP